MILTNTQLSFVDYSYLYANVKKKRNAPYMPKHKTWKLILKQGDRHYKALVFWGWKKDATLFVEVCSTKHELSEIKNVEEVKRINPDGTYTASRTILYEDIVPSDFISQKHSFHPSGYTHITNKKGEKHQLGIRSLPFEKIETFRALALVVPHDPSTYPAVLKEQIKDELDVVIDTNILKNSPFQIEIYIVRGDVQSIVKPAVEPNTTTIDIECGTNETYMLLVRCKQSNDMIGKAFPPQTLFGTVVQNEPNNLTE